MKKLSSIGKSLATLLIVLGMSCSEEEVSNCIINKAILSYYNPSNKKTELVTKFVYEHDGTNYYKITTYFNIAGTHFSETPSSFVSFSYDDEKISEVLIENEEGGDDYTQIFFSYPAEGTISKRFVVVTNGVVTFEQTRTLYYLVTPEDGLHLSQNEIGEDILLDYKNGNLLQVGFEEVDGSVDAFNKKWEFKHFYEYDKLPYLLKDYAVRYPIGNVDEFSVTRNNLIVLKFPLTEDTFTTQNYSWKTYHGKWIKSYQYLGTGRTVTYDCTCK